MDFSMINIDKFKEKFFKIIKIASLIFGILCLICGLLPFFFFFHINAGNVALVIYALLIFFVLFYSQENLKKDIHRRILKIFKRVTVAFLLICFLAGFIISLFMIKYAFFNKPNENSANQGTVVVLGCKINNEEPSRTLQGRLDAAYEYLSANDAAVAVVSGGRGWDEVISEASVMKNYLIEKGISEDRIYMEDESLNTDENIRFSGEIIKEYNLPTQMYIVTDTFHSCRAYMFAKKNGYEAKNISSDIYLPLIGEYWVRDILGIIHLFFTPNWKLNIQNS